MKPNIATNPILMQAGCAGVQSSITLKYSSSNPLIGGLSTEDNFTVKTTYQGQPHIQSYSKATGSSLQIQADANTEIVIVGKVTEFRLTNEQIGSENLKSFVANKQKELLTLTFYTAGSGMLTTVDVSCCESLDSLNLSYHPQLVSLNCNGCSNLTSVDLSNCTMLTHLDLDGCTGLTEIKIKAINEQPSNSVASAITSAISDDGSVYLYMDTYDNIISDAANTKGWYVVEPGPDPGSGEG